MLREEDIAENNRFVECQRQQQIKEVMTNASLKEASAAEAESGDKTENSTNKKQKNGQNNPSPSLSDLWSQHLSWSSLKKAANKPTTSKDTKNNALHNNCFKKKFKKEIKKASEKKNAKPEN